MLPESPDLKCPYCDAAGPFYEMHNGVPLYPDLGKEVRGCFNCQGVFGVFEDTSRDPRRAIALLQRVKLPMVKFMAEKSEAIRLVLGHRVEKITAHPNFPGRIPPALCPRCGQLTFAYVGSYKTCSFCGYSSYHEGLIADIKRAVERGAAEVDVDLLEKEILPYLKRLRLLEAAPEVKDVGK